MKKIVRLYSILLLALLGLSNYSMAQTLTNAEYFFDSDPGVGKGTVLTMSSSDSLTLNKSISTASLSNGFHNLFIRFKNANNTWGIAEARGFAVITAPTFPTYQISTGEYFFDTDPGFGNGTPYATGTTDSLTFNKAISLPALSTGTHTLYWRFKNTNNSWSEAEARSFDVVNPSITVASARLTYGEYFIDSDPGLGKAIPISVGAVDSVSKNISVNLISLSQGAHWLTVRMRDSVGKWTMPETRYFAVAAPAEKTAPLTSLEYFIDTDPGVGNGTVIQAANNKDTLIIKSAISDKGLALGSHIIMVRAKDSLNRYSLVDAKSFYICSVFPIANFTADYSGNDSTVVFTNLTTGANSSTKYYWDLNGDGINDTTSLNPTHKYVIPGTYNVRLITSNGGSCIDTLVQKVKATADTCNLTSQFVYSTTATNEIDFQDQSVGTVGSYYWNFGDGYTSTQANPNHTYAQAGNYEVSLAIKSSKNSCNSYSSQVVSVGKFGCLASYSNIITDATKTASFTDKSIGNNLRYFWYFGDGSFSIDRNPVHKFANDGVFNVSLTISTTDGTCSNESKSYIQVGTVKCNAAFTYYVDSTSNMAYFSDQIIGPYTNLYWTFGDGKNSTQNNPSHAYAHPGYYTVGLNTFNGTNYCMDYYEQSIIVGQANSDCMADFIYQADTTTATVRFYDASKGDIIGYIWNFGDENKIAQKNPVHSYAPAGYKNVCLTVVNSVGITSFKCKSVYSASFAKDDCKSAFAYNVDSASQHAYYNDVSIGKPNNWNWDLGNGVKATTQNGDVKYTSSGYYIVSLKITNTTTGCASKSVKVVGVGNNQKHVKAGFGFDPKVPGTKADGYPVDFTGTGVGDHARLRWTFGDSTSTANSDTTTLSPTHTYTQPGTYNVCLTIKNQLTGDSDVYCQESITASPTLVSAQNMVQNFDLWPNPTNDFTNIRFVLKQPTFVEISIIDLQGKTVERIINTEQTAGEHVFTWNSASLSKGSYIILYKGSNGLMGRKMLIKQ